MFVMFSGTKMCIQTIPPTPPSMGGVGVRLVLVVVFSSQSFGGDRGHLYSLCNPPERHFQWGLIVD